MNARTPRLSLPLRSRAGPAPVRASLVRCTVTRREVGPWTVVAVCGELEVASEPTFASVLADAGPHVVLDLEDVTFIDAAGLGCLVRWARFVRLRGGSLIVANPSRQVRRLMVLTRLDHALGVAESVDDVTSTSPVTRGR